MKIWCLFGVENNYDQPDNDLIAAVKLHQGEVVRHDNTDFRLREVEEGE